MHAHKKGSGAASAENKGGDSMCSTALARPAWLALRKLGASATVKLPLPQYSSNRSPSVLPAVGWGRDRGLAGESEARARQAQQPNASDATAALTNPPVTLRAQASMCWHMPPLGWLKEASTWICCSCCPSTLSTSCTSSPSKHSFCPLHTQTQGGRFWCSSGKRWFASSSLHSAPQPAAAGSGCPAGASTPAAPDDLRRRGAAGRLRQHASQLLRRLLPGIIQLFVVDQAHHGLPAQGGVEVGLHRDARSAREGG